MTREEFNNLDVSKQINYFNEKLKDADNNFNKLCRSIGVSKNTVLNRFKNNGYTANKEGQKIISFTTNNLETKDVETKDTNSLETKDAAAKDNNNLETKDAAAKDNNNLETKDAAAKANNNLETKDVETKDVETKDNDLHDINLILKRIDVLEEEIEKLKNENHKEVNKFILDDFSGTTTTRTFKIDVIVNKELEQFLNKYSMYKKQDVISSLLKFAIDNIE